MNKLEFGFAREDITPDYGVPLCGYLNPRPNEGAYDPLQLKAAVFRTGTEVAAVVSYDLCFFDRKFVDKLEEMLAARKSPLCGKVLYCATHTHTGPYTSECFCDGCVSQSYMEDLANKTIAALGSAFRSLAPAELFTTVTECSGQAFNRRYIMKNGKTLTNPGKLNADILHPEGAVDNSLMIVEIRQQGRPALIIANLSNHTDTIGGNLVSADWPGVMEAEIQHELQSGVPVMTIVAPQGNINHFNVNTAANQTSYAEARRLGKAYASAVIAARYALKELNDCQIKTAANEFEAPYMQISDAEYAEAKAVYEANKDAVMEAGRDVTSEDIAKGVPCVQKFFAEATMECRENPILEQRFERQIALMFGEELAIVSFPAEPFVEIGMAVRKASRFPVTMLAALGMGEVGYVGLPNNYGNGGYETIPSRAKPDRHVGETMIDNALLLLK